MYDSYPKLLTLLISLSLATPFLTAQSDDVKQLVLDLDSPASSSRAEAFVELLDMEDIDRDLRLSFRSTSDIETRVQLIDLVAMRESEILIPDTLPLLGSDDDRLVQASRDYLLYANRQAVVAGLSELSTSDRTQAVKLLTFRVRMEALTVLVRSYMMPGDFLGKFSDLPEVQDLESVLVDALMADPKMKDPLSHAVNDVRKSDKAFQHLTSTNWRRVKRIREGIPYAFSALQPDADLEAIRQIPRRDFLASLELIQGVRRAAGRALGHVGDETTVNAIQAAYQDMLDFKPLPELHHVVRMGAIHEELEVSLARLGHSEMLDARIARLTTAAKQATEVERATLNARITARPDLQSLNQVGHLQHRAGQHKAAEATWTKLLKELEMHSRLQSNSRALSSLSSMLSVVYYNLACAQSVQLKLSRSLENLKKAHKHGYKDFAWITIDGDLEVLRDSPAFVEWFDEHAPPSLVGTIND